MEQTMEVDEDSRLEMNADVDPSGIDGQGPTNTEEVRMSTDEDSNSMQNAGAAMKSADVTMASDSPANDGPMASDSPTNDGRMASDSPANDGPMASDSPTNDGPTEMETDPIGLEASAVPKAPPDQALSDNEKRVEEELEGDESQEEGVNGAVPSGLETADERKSPERDAEPEPERVEDDGSEDDSRGKGDKADSGNENEDPLLECESHSRTDVDQVETSNASNADNASNSVGAFENENTNGSSVKAPRSPQEGAEGKSLADELKSLADELSEVRAQSTESGLKAVEADHISLGSSEPGGDAGPPDHVSIASSDAEDAPDHVSVDSDSETEASKSASKTEEAKGPDHTAPIDSEVEADSSHPKRDVETASSSKAAAPQVTPSIFDSVEVSDDESETPPTAPPAPEPSKGMITVLKTSDTEMITSDGPVAATSTLPGQPQATVGNDASPEPVTFNRATSDISKAALKSQYSVRKIGTPIFEKCLHCTVNHKCPWKVNIGGTEYYICSDKCMEAHRVQRRQIIENGAPPVSTIIQISDLSDLLRKCVSCSKDIPKNKAGSLTWEVMEFCDEDCLAKYQMTFTSTCCNCKNPVVSSSMGKYCVRFGHEVKQFCAPNCLDTYKKGIKTCSYCQKNLQDDSEGFLAAVGGKDQFRDFCSQDCLDKYDCICNNSSSASYSVANCVVCDNVKVTFYELLSGSKVATLCSDVCLAAYKFVNTIEVGVCGMCNKYYDKNSVDESITFNNDAPSSFCSKHCMNISVISKRKIVPCAWCKAKKYNFDMIYKRGNTDDDGLFVCSVNCLALHSVSTKAMPPKKVVCSYCKKVEVSTYHITMSDASIRHFCSYDCVLAFQAPFNTTAALGNVPVPTGAPKKVTSSPQGNFQIMPAGSSGPTIQSVGTLKPYDVPPLVASSTPKGAASSKLKSTTLKIPASFSYSPPEMKNRWTQITVCSTHKCVSCRPKVEHRDTQCSMNGTVDDSGLSDGTTKMTGTDGESSTKAVIPIPVPIYVPYPCAMYTLPSPIPLAVPVPIVVPIIIPTSLENMDRVIDTMKEILEKSAKRLTSSDGGASSSCDEMLQLALNSMAGDLEPNEEVESSESRRRKRDLVDDDSSPDEVKPSKRVRIVDDSPEEESGQKQIKLKYMLGLRVWSQFVKRWNDDLEVQQAPDREPMKTDLLAMRPHELNDSLVAFVREMKKSNGSDYKPDVKYYVCLGIQYYLSDNGRTDDIFGDAAYEEFTDALDVEAQKFQLELERPTSKVEEEHLWESMQLGPKSPYVLLMTLMYFITLHFNLRTVEEHMQLSFHSFGRVFDGPARNTKVVKLVLNSDGGDPKKTKECELVENKENPMRCPIRFYEFYLTKCPESPLTTHKDRFYLMPETSCAPESPVWYRTIPLPSQAVEKMLNRVKLIKEICDAKNDFSEQSNPEASL